MNSYRAPRQELRALTAVMACLVLSACAVADVEPVGDGPLGLSIRALSSTCSGTPNANPFQDVKNIAISVRAEDIEAFGQSVTLKGKSIKVAEVPAGSGREITLLGKNAAGKKLWFGRKSGVKVVKNTTTNLDITLMALDAFTCVSPVSAKASSVIFPSVTRFANGKVLITGGFALAKTSGKNLLLTQPLDRAYIFDANTGKMRELKNQERMNEGRGGHSAVYLPASNRVLIVGGAREMTAPTNKSGPPTWQPAKATNITYEIFDVATEKFLKPFDASLGHSVKRVFPNLMALAGDYVVSLGGAQWPTSLTADQQTYLNSDLYDPQAPFDPTLNSKDERLGAFVKNGAALPLTEVRAGAALAFVGTTALGVSKYLIWGGGGTVAEVFTESSSPGDGTFDNTYVIEGDIIKKKGSLYFSSLTSLGASAGNDGRFLSIGGIRHDGKKWLAPSADDAYLVVLTTPDKGKKRINTIRISGLGAGIYMHQASLTDDNHVLVSGGFNKFGQPSSVTMRTFDISPIQDKANMDKAAAGKLKLSLKEPASAKAFVKRGGHGAVRLNNDCILAFGGVTDLVDLLKTGEAASDIYCPQHLDPDL